MEHYSNHQILMFASRGESPAHVNECAFCREQLILANEYLVFESEQEVEIDDPEDDYSPYLSYRLAAQTSETGQAMFRLRRTWYLENNSVVLRVIEDLQRKVLTGFMISERPRIAHAQIRFDGIDRVFVPDLNGVFEIGSASIDIEPMIVTVSGF